MTTVLVTVCDVCEKRILPGALVAELIVKHYECGKHNSSRMKNVEVCGDCAATKAFKLDPVKGLVPA